MTERHYDVAKKDLLSKMQRMREQRGFSASLVPVHSDSSLDDEFDDILSGPSTSIAYQLSQRELAEFKKFKRSVFFPHMKSEKTLCNKDGKAVIKLGKVTRPVHNLPSGHNLAEYINGGWFNLLGFFDDHSVQFPYLQMKSEKSASYTVAETDCKRFLTSQAMPCHLSGLGYV